ncbi:hypothetical protein COU61_01975 [Candidatus Pacearchaeota archaeon CG10_big_fil_rev_8_21_14_0_10_35_13]|nr:MAG: hypothetical protein COU61_01975 [Candidatus Pacearchaeota archaeon CG10_big_fil_rev_8_21_14_0_10_35_13]
MIAKPTLLVDDYKAILHGGKDGWEAYRELERYFDVTHIERPDFMKRVKRERWGITHSPDEVMVREMTRTQNNNRVIIIHNPERIEVIEKIVEGVEGMAICRTYDEINKYLTEEFERRTGE